MIKKYGTKKPVILIINSFDNDDPYIRSLSHNYKVIQTRPTKIITNLVIELLPCIIILDGNEYGINLFHEFKSISATRHIPIVFDIVDIYSFSPKDAISLGAIDYIYSSIDITLMELKFNNYIQLNETIKFLRMQANIAMESNPNTGLPGNNAIVSNIYYSLENSLDNVVVYVDLDHFKPYNDYYGFGKGDEVIKLTSDIIASALKNINDYTFLGHIGGDDYVFIVPRKDVISVTDYIINTFDSEIQNYYDSEVMKNKCITTLSRTGQTKNYPIMTISMGGVCLIHHNMNTRFEEISDLCSEVKKHAKSYPYSYFYMDKRNTTRFNTHLN